MKGVVFTEFLSMVETAHGTDMVDDIIDLAKPENDGAYTSVGTYDHRELFAMVAALSEQTGTPVPELVRAFGRYIFPRLVAIHPPFVESCGDAFRFLESIHGHIHVEVRKLYPDAELPAIEAKASEDGRRLRLVYVSRRGLDDFAYGLIEGALLHYGEEASIEQTPLGDGRSGSEFIVTRVLPVAQG